MERVWSQGIEVLTNPCRASSSQVSQVVQVVHLPMWILFARGCAEIPHALTPREEDTMFPPLSFFYVAGGSVIRGRSPTSKGSSLNRSEWEFTSTGAAPWHHGCW